MSTVALREQGRAAAGAAVGVFLAGLLCHLAAGRFGWSPWLVAPIGASAVLVFALPASPLAQPWPVIAGNTLSACVGVAVGLLLPDPVWAGAVAVGLAILAMFLLRCLHPPGGAVALLAVLTQAASPRWPFFPVMADSLLLVLAGAAWNTLTGRSYPHRPVAAAQPVSARFTQADIDAAVSRYGQVLDLGRDDLAGLLESAQAHAYGRRLGSLRCVDVMSPDPVVADYDMPLEEAWRLLRERRIKALPVVDRGRRLIGLVTVADFMRQAQALHADGPDVVGNIMSREVCSVVDERPVIDLLPLFAERGHHHIPVVDAAQRIQGIVTPTDLMRAMMRAELS